MARLADLLDKLVRGLNALAALAGAGIMGLIVASVIARHVLGAPLRVTPDLTGLLVVAMLFLALPLTTLRGEHVSVTVLTARLGRYGQLVADAIAQLVLIAFALWLFWIAADWFAFTWERGLRTAIARVPLTPWAALVPSILLLLAGLGAWRLVARRQRGDAP